MAVGWETSTSPTSSTMITVDMDMGAKHYEGRRTTASMFSVSDRSGDSVTATTLRRPEPCAVPASRSSALWTASSGSGSRGPTSRGHKRDPVLIAGPIAGRRQHAEPSIGLAVAPCRCPRAVRDMERLAAAIAGGPFGPPSPQRDHRGRSGTRRTRRLPGISAGLTPHRQPRQPPSEPRQTDRRPLCRRN
jgi:hypothetical protein